MPAEDVPHNGADGRDGHSQAGRLTHRRPWSDSVRNRGAHDDVFDFLGGLEVRECAGLHLLYDREAAALTAGAIRL